MCPLRIILIFLSASLAGFFVLRNLKSQPQQQQPNIADSDTAADDSSDNSSKVFGVIGKGFWTFVDMASGKYLWKNLVSSPPSISVTKRVD